MQYLLYLSTIKRRKHTLKLSTTAGKENYNRGKTYIKQYKGNYRSNQYHSFAKNMLFKALLWVKCNIKRLM